MFLELKSLSSGAQRRQIPHLANVRLTGPTTDNVYGPPHPSPHLNPLPNLSNNPRSVFHYVCQKALAHITSSVKIREPNNERRKINEIKGGVPGMRGGGARWHMRGWSGGTRWKQRPWRLRSLRRDPTRGCSGRSCKHGGRWSCLLAFASSSGQCYHLPPNHSKTVNKHYFSYKLLLNFFWIW